MMLLQILIMACVNIWPILDESAFNYDASANVNDGSCIDVVLGCIELYGIKLQCGCKYR